MSDQEEVVPERDPGEEIDHTAPHPEEPVPPQGDPEEDVDGRAR